jgi:4-hydroxy-tetrahydrodipicolinate reductase
MGKAVINAAEAAGLNVVPVSFGCEEESGQTFEVCGREFLVHGPSDRESFLESVRDKFPNLIIVDYTVPDAVNGMYFEECFLIVVETCNLIFTFFSSSHFTYLYT